MARDEKVEHLRAVPLFQRLGSRELERLAQLADEVDVGLGDILARQGDTGHEFFIVLDGHVTVLIDNKAVAHLSQGDFFGEIALIDDRPRTATVRADGITRLLVLAHREFHALMDEFPEIRRAVLAALADRLRRLEADEAR